MGHGRPLLMGNQYSDASGGDLANEGDGVPPPPAPEAARELFQPSHQVSIPLPVGGSGGGSAFRDFPPLLGTPDEFDSVPVSFGPQSAPNDVGSGLLKAGMVHTRTHSFDAGDLSAKPHLPFAQQHMAPRSTLFTIGAAAQVQVLSISLLG